MTDAIAHDSLDQAARHRRDPALHRAAFVSEGARRRRQAAAGGGPAGGGTVGPPNFFLAPIDESASVDLDPDRDQLP